MLHHHAQLIAGNHKAYEALLKKIEKELGLGKTHPDLMAFSFGATGENGSQKLGVEEAGMIRDAVMHNPAVAPQIVVAIYAHTLTEQAQNALLKICEEPPRHSYIFLVTDFLPHLIPTLRSRFVSFEFDADDEADISGIGSAKREDDVLGREPGDKASTKRKEKAAELLSADMFLKSSVDQRLSIAKDLHAAMDKESVGIAEIWNFANQIERAIHARLIASPAVAGTSPEDLESQERMRDALDVLSRTQQYMHAPGNSVKMLLEYLAVRL